jgi:flagellar motor protein MotB
MVLGWQPMRVLPRFPGLRNVTFSAQRVVTTSLSHGEPNQAEKSPERQAQQKQSQQEQQSEQSQQEPQSEQSQQEPQSQQSQQKQQEQQFWEPQSQQSEWIGGHTVACVTALACHWQCRDQGGKGAGTAQPI